MKSQILEGNLELPSYQSFMYAYPEHIRTIESFWKALWFSFLKDEGSINSIYWAERFDNAEIYNVVLKSLSKANWIISHAIPERNWAEIKLNKDKLLEYVTIDELLQIRAYNKFKEYMPTNSESNVSNLTKVNGKTKDTGLVREGFMKAGNSKFKYDTKYISDYKDIITMNVSKGMDKVKKLHPNMVSNRATYDSISIDVLDYIENSNESFTTGNNYSDSRGRAISDCLSYVFNPIGFKDARALIRIK